MSARSPAGRRPISDAHLRLGQALRRARMAAGLSTRQIAGYTPGHVSNVENGYTTPSVELVDLYAGLVADGSEIRALYQQMVAAAQEAGRWRRRRDTMIPSRPPPQSMDDVTGRSDVQRHYVVERHEAHHVFTATGAISSIHYEIAIRALAPGVRMYYAGQHYPADPRPGTLRVVGGAKASLLASHESDSGALQSYFRLDQPLSPDDPDAYRLSFDVEVRSTVRSRPMLAYHAAAFNQALSVHAQFDESMSPRKIWWFAAPDVIDADSPLPTWQLPVSRAETYQRAFNDLVPGWCYGLAWIWRI